MSSYTDPRRNIPSLDVLLGNQKIRDLIDVYGREVVLKHLKLAVDSTRDHIGETKEPSDPTTLILMKCESSLRHLFSPSLKRVINATGVLLHTNMGRAPLGESALAEIVSVCASYSSLEMDLNTGERSDRHSHVEQLLIEMTGCEAACVMNNNAGATLLVLRALIGDHPERNSVLISRGELIEIGGGFRMPDVMSQSGAIMVEVGTTNRTHLSDYQKGLNPDVAAVFRAHTSNFRIEGFTAKPSSRELATFSHENGLIFIDDIGSGAFTTLKGIEEFHEPIISDSVAVADIVLFSSDKLLGGPQSGIILGKRALIEVIKKHPLARALRPDKLCLAALQATLRAYLDNSFKSVIPLWQMLETSLEELLDHAGKMKSALQLLGYDVDVIEEKSPVGGGTLPGVSMPTACVLVKTISPEAIAQRLRNHTVPIIVRKQAAGVLIDMRTIFPRDNAEIIDCFRQIKEDETYEN